VWTTLQNPVIPSFINKQITNELILVVSNWVESSRKLRVYIDKSSK
jgi:hypothetical protein